MLNILHLIPLLVTLLGMTTAFLPLPLHLLDTPSTIILTMHHLQHTMDPLLLLLLPHLLLP